MVIRSATDAKDGALAELEAKHGRKLLIIQHQFVSALLSKSSASLNDLELPPDLRGSFLGTIHRPFLRINAITEAGLVRSNRKACHSRRISCWGVVDSMKLRAWLEANPLPKPGPQLQRSLAFDESGASS